MVTIHQDAFLPCTAKSEGLVSGSKAVKTDSKTTQTLGAKIELFHVQEK